MSRLSLPEVTLCAITSVNVAATIAAMRKCMEKVDFARCILLTDAEISTSDDRIEHVRIEQLKSASAYSEFVLCKAGAYIDTSHCLIVQWDGYILDAGSWRPEFLNFDYIGASWPQFSDRHNVGNGGFSLRSRRLMLACAAPNFQICHPEDVAIGRTNRPWLEGLGLNFATRALADQFSTERSGELSSSMGFHGVFNMQRAMGDDAFWAMALSLDDRSSFSNDGWRIFRQARLANKIKAAKFIMGHKMQKYFDSLLR